MEVFLRQWRSPRSSMRRGFLAVCLALMITGAWAASPGPIATDTVKRLYQNYSWEATMIGGPGPWIGDAPKTALDQYFDSDLAAVWLKSRTCGGDCAVDWIGYDPLWDSMDPSGFSNVRIEGTNDPRVVKVEMNGPCVPGQQCKPEGSGRVGLTYFLKPTGLGWRISDIQSEVHGSLKAALVKALSEH